MSGHALLSPSSAERWLNCTPSVRLEAQFEDHAGTAAEEGSLAHRLGELLLKLELKRIPKHEYEIELADIQRNSLYSSSMLDYCQDYADFVMEQYNAALAEDPEAVIVLEEKVDLRAYFPEAFGTTDITIISSRKLRVIDLKFGKGVKVSAVENKQTLMYGLGSYTKYDFVYGIDEVEMTIFQPRIDNISSWSITSADLLTWADDAKQKAEQAFRGEGEFVAGAHCKFCKARAVCRANHDRQLEMANLDFKAPDILSDKEVSFVLDRLAELTSWAKSVHDYAIREAVTRKKEWPGYKVVEGRSNRKYTNETEVEKYLVDLGHDPEKMYKKKMIGLTDMEKLVTKKVVGQLEGLKLVVKPPGKPALAPLSDKRPVFNSPDMDFDDDIDI